MKLICIIIFVNYFILIKSLILLYLKVRNYLKKGNLSNSNSLVWLFVLSDKNNRKMYQGLIKIAICIF